MKNDWEKPVRFRILSRHTARRSGRSGTEHEKNTSQGSPGIVINRLSTNGRPVAALALLALIWGYNWVVMKKSLQFMGPFDFNATRMLLGGLILLALMAGRGMSLRPKQVPLTILLGLLQTAAGTGLIIWALISGGAGKTSVLVYTMPFWILLFARPILGETIRGTDWLPVMLAFTGLVLLLEPWSLKATLMSEILAVLAGVFWALSAIVIKWMQRKPDFDLVSATAWQFIYGSVPLVIAAALVPSPPVQWTPYLVTAIAYNAILVCALAFLLWTYIMNKLPAGVAGMGTMAVPVIGMTASILELGERMDVSETAGIFLILTALSILTWLKGRDGLAVIRE
ncbi:MAG: EamA family transporter [Deltaproteobacteria bacterium HGW-Deltaproteobacteria-19]|nr:MAG: EamA family transporter [Deltaproteobacteria bacterium HGW-Deltaproteobacteria-19]